MNTHSTLHRLGSFAMAAVFTIGMLMAIQSLATSDPSPGLLARVAPAASAS